VGQVKPLVTSASFACVRCGYDDATSLRVLFLDGKFRLPEGCADSRCRAKGFGLQRRFSTLRDLQVVRLQQSNDSFDDCRRLPQSIDVELVGSSLVGLCMPGDDVVVIGIVKSVNADVAGGRHDRRALDRSVFLLYLEAISLQNLTRTHTTHLSDVARPCSDSSRAVPRLQAIVEVPKLAFSLVSSLCPSIHGHLVAKFGLLLALFGGGDPDYEDDRYRLQNSSIVGFAQAWESRRPSPSVRGVQSEIVSSSSKFCDLLEKDTMHMPVRKNSHVLIVGDPGLGKSQLLRACSAVAPRSVYVGANATTTSIGLTASLCRDSRHVSVLETGALVIADRGACCFGEDHQLLTSQGFRFLDEVTSSDADLTFAAYDRRTRTICYERPLQLITRYALDQKLIDFTEKCGFYGYAAPASLQHQGHKGGHVLGKQQVSPEFCGVSIAATPDHDFFVSARTTFGVRSSLYAYQKRKAADLAQGNTSHVFQFLAHARSGMPRLCCPDSMSVRDAILAVGCADSEVAQLRVLETFGSWLCAGWMLIIWHVPYAIEVTVPIMPDIHSLVSEHLSNCKINFGLARSTLTVRTSKFMRFCLCEYWKRTVMHASDTSGAVKRPSASARWSVGRWRGETRLHPLFLDSCYHSYYEMQDVLKTMLVRAKQMFAYCRPVNVRIVPHKHAGTAVINPIKILSLSYFKVLGLCCKLIWGTRHSYESFEVKMWTSRLQTSTKRFLIRRDISVLRSTRECSHRTASCGQSTERYIRMNTILRLTAKSLCTLLKAHSAMVHTSWQVVKATSMYRPRHDFCKCVLALGVSLGRISGSAVFRFSNGLNATAVWTHATTVESSILDAFWLASKNENCEIGVRSRSWLHMKPGRWIPWWSSLLHLSCARAFLSHTSSTGVVPDSVLQTNDSHFRDELVVLILHAGYATRCTYSSAAEFNVARGSGAVPTRHIEWNIEEVAYQGRTWCVTVPKGLIIVRRAHVDESGTVARASQPTLQGNCIDELDKLDTSQYVGLLEVMEQQQLSIAKAGVVATLLARTSVLAAANPTGSADNKAQILVGTLGRLSAPLLSRFDLVFVLTDDVDNDEDRWLSAHVIRQHKKHVVQAPLRDLQGVDPGLALQDQTQELRTDSSAWTLEEHGLMCDLKILKRAKLRGYITYARKVCAPKLSRAATLLLRCTYLLKRQYAQQQQRPFSGTRMEFIEKTSDNPHVPVTMRQLESIIRLAKARARFEMRDIVSHCDAADVIKVLEVAHLFEDTSALVATNKKPSAGDAMVMRCLIAALTKAAHTTGNPWFTGRDVADLIHGNLDLKTVMRVTSNPLTFHLNLLRYHNLLLYQRNHTGQYAYRLSGFEKR